MVSNCSISETGGVYSRQLGDQTKREYYVREWYNYGQRYVLRHPNLQIGIQIAQLGRDAANNDHIGYGWGQRMTFYHRLRQKTRGFQS